jgi:acetyltransferase-like isoleucine patch superfamily enzyme
MNEQDEQGDIEKQEWLEAIEDILTSDGEIRAKDILRSLQNYLLNAGVEIEEGAFIGSGVTIVGGVKIGKNARIGAGSVVIADVAKNKTVFGNPAQEIGK